MKVAYIAHPFVGKPENVQDVQRIILELVKKYPKFTFYSPLHCTGFYYHEIPYDVGMEHCYEFLKRSDQLWLCNNWENSRGCNLEYNFAYLHLKPIYLIQPDFSLKPYRNTDQLMFE